MKRYKKTYTFYIKKEMNVGINLIYCSNIVFSFEKAAIRG